MPGYLPESDPEIFATRDEAVAYVKEELERGLDSTFDDDDADDDRRGEYVEAIAGIEEAGLVEADKHVFWVDDCPFACEDS